MSDYEFYSREAESAVSTNTRLDTATERAVILNGADADAAMEIYSSSTYWQRAMSAAAWAYARAFGLTSALEAEYRLMVD